MIDNGFCRIPADRCDYGYGHGRRPGAELEDVAHGARSVYDVVAVVAMVNVEHACTVERRPACLHHLAGMSYTPDAVPFRFEVHWLDERNADTV